MPGQTVERDIYFFRADIGKDDNGNLLPFDPGLALTRIRQLPFSEGDGGRYEDDLEGNVLCLFHTDPGSKEVQFCRIRRTGLPQLETAGNLTELTIGPNTGLSEAVQVMFFPNNITGIVYNHYGPRLSRLGSYLYTKSGHTIPLVKFRPLLSADVAKQLDQLGDIRLFDLSVQPSYASVIRSNDDSLGDVIDANIRFQGPEDLISVTAKYSGIRRQSMLARISSLARRLLLLDDLRPNVERFKVKGKLIDTGKVETIDLLSNKLISAQSIVRLSDRSRALEPDSAFRAISRAYENFKDDLDQAYSVSP